MRRNICVLSTVGLACLCTSLAAAAPVGWRQDGTGRFPDADPPLEWSAETNIVWRTALPNESNASPIIVGDRIFVCAEPDRLLCLALADGEILWDKPNPDTPLLTPEEVALADQITLKIKDLQSQQAPLRKELQELRQQRRENPRDEKLKARIDELTRETRELRDQINTLRPQARPETHRTNGFASATPTSDGRFVYVFFGSGVAACYDLDGHRKWARVVQKPDHEWGHSSSPLLAAGHLIVQVKDIFALDVNTGETVWTQPCMPRWGSPVRTAIGDAEVIVTPNGDVLRASDGKQLATRVADVTYCAPVVQDGIAYFIQNGGQAVTLPTAIEGVPETLWNTSPKKERYYASPLIHEGLIYAITRYNDLSVIDANTGEVVYFQALDFGKGDVYPSILLAGEHVHVSHENGTTLVLEPGREYKELARNNLEPFRGTPVLLGKRMYVRGLKHMWCIGK